MKASSFKSRVSNDEITIVADNPIAIGTLLAILKDVSEQTGIDIDDLKFMVEQV